MKYTFLYLLIIFIFSNIHFTFSQKQTAHPKTFDVIVDTDLGGDPDDIQSLFRLLHYSDILKVKAIVSTPCTDVKSHPWDTVPNVELIKYWVKRIDSDHLRKKGYTRLMKERDILKVVYPGSQTSGAPTKTRSSEGSRRIIDLAQQYSAKKPVWVLVWGSMTTVAQALHDEPTIAPNIRIYSIGSTNTQHDSLSRNFVYHFMKDEFPGLWWIENGILPKGSHETFRGVYQGGEQSGEWGMQNFVHENIRGHGSDHNGLFKEICGDVFPLATYPKGSLKEGDSPTMLFLISPVIAGLGDVNDPTSESWGGTFRKALPDKYPNYYVDLDKLPNECQATINKWRLDFLSDWKKRWDRYNQ